MREKLLKEIKGNKLIYTLLLVVVLVSLFVRIYRVNELLEFYFDQGRDAKVIWEFIKNGKPFLVGPVTGLEGVFLGPFFYYLLSVLYFIGRGDPVYPAIFIGILSSLSVLATYYLGFRSHSRVTGLIAATIWAFSYYLLIYGRWLANPSPMLLLSPIFFISLINISERKRDYWWVVVALLLGLALQLELASAFFYLPAFALFTLLNYKNLPPVKIILISVVSFLITFVPQIIFNLRHDNVLVDALSRAFKNNDQVNLSFRELFLIRRELYSKIFGLIIFPSGGKILFAYFWGIVAIYIANIKELIAKKRIIIFLIFIVSPITGFLFFRANEGNVYDYYFIGYFVAFVVLLSIGLSYLSKNWFGWIFLATFFVFFLKDNLPPISGYLQKGRAPFTFSDQKKAIKWILDDTKGEFNLYVWVPPVIPHSYEYLITWLGPGKIVRDREVRQVYALYEEPGNLSRELNYWIEAQNMATLVEEEINFRGITVQRRIRK